jgi:hypothetical protein
MSEPDNDSNGESEELPESGGGPWAKTSSGDADSITEDSDDDD